MSMKGVTAVLFSLLAAAGSAQAAGPSAGGWRSLPIGPAYSVSEQRSAFVMLPADAGKGSRFTVMDLTRGQPVCCLEVSSPRLQQATLEHSYQVPRVWASDLTSGLDNGAGGASHVFAARPVGRLLGYRFEGHFTESGEWGGLLLPADAQAAGPGKVSFGGATYTVVRTVDTLPDDDGGLETYRLTPETGGAPQTVDVRFGTN